MVDKETCVRDINKFIQSKNINDAVVLLEYLCEIKETPNKGEAINQLISNPMLLSVLLPQTIEELERHFNLVRLSDKNNNIISVY